MRARRNSRGSYGCSTKLACLRPPSNGPRKPSLSQSCGGGLAGAGAPELAGAGVAPSLLASAPWLAMVCGRSRALLTRSQCTKTAAGTNIHSTKKCGNCAESTALAFQNPDLGPVARTGRQPSRSAAGRISEHTVCMTAFCSRKLQGSAPCT